MSQLEYFCLPANYNKQEILLGGMNLFSHSPPTPLIINRCPTREKCWAFSHLEFPLIIKTGI